MIQEMLIMGAKPSNFEIDGKSYDSTKIYVQTKMSDIGCGFSSTEYNWGDSTNFDKIKDQTYPFLAHVDLEIVTSGRTTKIVVTDVKPINPKKNN